MAIKIDNNLFVDINTLSAHNAISEFSKSIKSIYDKSFFVSVLDKDKDRQEVVMSEKRNKTKESMFLKFEVNNGIVSLYRIEDNAIKSNIKYNNMNELSEYILYNSLIRYEKGIEKGKVLKK